MVLFTNTLPSRAFRGYGLSRLICAVDSAISTESRKLGIDELGTAELGNGSTGMTIAGRTDETATTDLISVLQKLAASRR